MVPDLVMPTHMMNALCVPVTIHIVILVLIPVHATTRRPALSSSLLLDSTGTLRIQWQSQAQCLPNHMEHTVPMPGIEPHTYNSRLDMQPIACLDMAMPGPLLPYLLRLAQRCLFPRTGALVLLVPTTTTTTATTAALAVRIRTVTCGTSLNIFRHFVRHETFIMLPASSLSSHCCRITLSTWRKEKSNNFGRSHWFLSLMFSVLPMACFP